MSPTNAHELRRRKVITSVVAASVLLHVIVGAVAAIWIVARYFAPPPAKFEVKKDLRIAAQDREHKLNMAAFDALTPKPSFDDKIASMRPSALSLPDLPKLPLDQIVPLDPAAMITDAMAGLTGAAGFGAAGGGAAGSGGDALQFGKMSFFGITDEARSVVIMIDVSDSMFTRTGDAAAGRLVKRGAEQSFQAVREEAIKLVQGLSVNARFGIVRWSGGAYSWKSELVAATDDNKREAVEHIQSQVDMRTARPKDGRPGGTRHDYALEEAFALKPEVIFMLSDGNATASLPGGGMRAIDAKDILAVAEAGQKLLDKRVRLHAIYYVTGADRPDERAMLASLARRNGGRFRQVKAPGAR